MLVRSLRAGVVLVALVLLPACSGVLNPDVTIVRDGRLTVERPSA